MRKQTCSSSLSSALPTNWSPPSPTFLKDTSARPAEGERKKRSHASVAPSQLSSPHFQVHISPPSSAADNVLGLENGLFGKRAIVRQQRHSLCTWLSRDARVPTERQKTIMCQNFPSLFGFIWLENMFLKASIEIVGLYFGSPHSSTFSLSAPLPPRVG